MTGTRPAGVGAAVAEAHRRGWAETLATVVRLTRDLDEAEDAVQEAFVSALATWPRTGVPRNPVAWITTTARRKALDRMRRRATLARKLPLLIVPDEPDERGERGEADGDMAARPHDDRLRLIFTCCHPAIAPQASVSLTLRLVCGLRVPEIARLFLVTESAMAARLTRAKKKIHEAGIPYRCPRGGELTERLPAVLAVISLLFTEGHTGTQGTTLTRPELLDQAIRLARLLTGLLPGESEVTGLLALLLLLDSRRAARVGPGGALVLLPDQDRSRWNAAAITEGRALVERALRTAHPAGTGPYALQAAIAALHAEAPTAADTDWRQIVALYDVLLAVRPSPVAALGRAVAVSMAAGPGAGLAELDRIAGDARFARYHRLDAARAQMLERLGRHTEAHAAYRRAADAARNTVERDFLTARADDTAPEP
ncbi:sigma-70 family RNA polymerase sigma factor [Actinomadura fulvescens]|uniref:Sigma-70 family RNA polymerase sigma factor n=1 Tax=Actinomadura fulvescens TaxID=46160 RepID=A0ABN3PLL8_9ACTN